MANQIFKFAQNFTFETERNVGTGSYPLLSPDFMLDMGKGDFRDHALLLCSLFLGAGFDAYVCMGKVHSDSGEENDHWWVMTREDHHGIFGEKPKKPVKKKGKKQAEKLTGAVKFWELSNKETYGVRNCWSARPYLRYYKIPRKRRYQKKAEAEEEKGSKKKHVESKMDVTERKFISDFKDDNDDGFKNANKGDKVTPEEIFLLGSVIEDDSFGCTVYEEEVLDMSLTRIGKVKIQKNATEDDEDTNASNKVKDDGREFIKKYNENTKLPYVKVYAIFNNANLWMCYQRDKNGTMIFRPERLRWDLHVDSDWLPLVHEDEENDERSFVEPHYPIRGLNGKLPDELVTLSEESVQMELEASILNIRDGNSLITVMETAENELLKGKLLQVILAKHEFENLDKNNCTGWDMKRDDWKAGSLGAGLKEAYDNHFSSLKDTVPDGYGFTTHFFVVSHSNSADVRKSIMQAESTRKMLLEKDKANFCVVTKLFPDFNAQLVTRVVIMSVFTDK